MGSFYQRVTGRRQLASTSANEDSTHWLPSSHEGASYHRRGSESRDERVVVVSGRSRSRTMNSAMSFYANSVSDTSIVSPRASSPHLTKDKEIPALQRREKTAKTILSKSSRMLRTHGSKFSLSSLHTMDSDGSEKYNNGQIHSGQTAKDRHNAIEAVKREGMKRTISEPFDFQHVTHTDRVFLKSMEHVPKTELVGEFSALRFGQASQPQLRGIRAEALPAQKQTGTAPTSPTTKSEMNYESSLPQTPPRPTPPPKDETDPLSPGLCIQTSRSADSFSRPSTSSSTSHITSPRRYSSRWAVPPPLPSPIRTLGAYVHSSSHSTDFHMADSTEDLCINCHGMNIVDDKPLPGLPVVHALTTDDDGAEYSHVTSLPLVPVDLADVPEELEMKRQSAIEPHLQVNAAKSSTPALDYPIVSSNTSRTSIVEGDIASPPCNRTFVVDDWDDAIDDSWDYAAEPDAIASPCHSSMTAQVASFVDKAMTRLAGPETAAFTSQEAEPASAESPPLSRSDSSIHPSELKVSIPDQSPLERSESSPLLGLGIELQHSRQQSLESCTTPTPAVASNASEPNDRGSSLTASFNSDFSAVSGISNCSSQESIIWSIASSIMGTQRSSNSSQSLLEQLPDYQQATKYFDDLKAGLERVQGDVEEIYDEQPISNESLDKPCSPEKQAHLRARSLATESVLSNAAQDVQRQRRTSSSTNNPRGSQGHERVLSGSRIPVPARKSSVKEQPEACRPPARRMRSATTTARSRHASRASYSLFPGASTIYA